MATVHITAAEAVRDFNGLLARVRAGEQVVIDDGEAPSVVLSPAVAPIRLLSEALQAARERGSSVALDEDFSDDVRSTTLSHPESLKNPWD